MGKICGLVMGTSHLLPTPGAADASGREGLGGAQRWWGTLPSSAGAGRRSGLGLGLELAAFGPLCNARQLEGFTFQREKENVKN